MSAKRALLVACTVAAACSSTTRGDRFFQLPIVSEKAATPDELAAAGDFLVQLTIRGDRGGPTLAAPSLATFAGQHASLSVSNPVAYVADFDPDVGPMIDRVEDGLVVDVVVTPTEDRAFVVVSYSLVTLDLKRPIRGREVAAGRTSVFVQLPETTRSRIVGRTRLETGHEILLARWPGATGELQASLRVVDRRRGAGTPAPLAHFPSRFGDAPLLAQAEAGAVDARDGWVRVRLLETPRGASSPDASEGATVLKEFLVRTSPASGVQFEHQLEKAYLGDYSVETGNGGSVADPQVATIRAGFAGRLESTKDGSALAYTWTALRGLGEFSTLLSDEGSPVVVEIPDLAVRSGRVPLSRTPTFRHVADLEDGRAIALLVELAP